MSKNLLLEYRPFEAKTISEGVHDNKPFTVTGVLQRADSKNQNGRVYPKDILMREAKKYSDTFIKEKRALGELAHPDSSVVNLQNVSHNVTGMKWDGDDLVGTVEVLTTPSGNILKELFKAGIKLGISSRGLGSVETIKFEGTEANKVGDDFELIAFDFVSNPSTQGAFLHPVNESIDKSRRQLGESCDKWCKVEYTLRDIIGGK